jgi:hypothetical protein
LAVTNGHIRKLDRVSLPARFAEEIEFSEIE